MNKVIETAESEHGADQTLQFQDLVRGLARDKLISARQAQQLLKSPPTGDTHPLTHLAELHLMNASDSGTQLDIEHLTRWLAATARLPYQHIDPLQIDVAKVTAVMKRSYAKRFNILPLAVDGKRITVATAQPWVREWETELTRTLGLEFERVVSDPQSISRYLDEFYAIGGSLLGASREHQDESAIHFGNLEQLVNLKDIDEEDPNHRHVVRIVDWLLQFAYEQRASDIHLEPRRDAGRVRFRIDGVLHLVNELPPTVMAAAISRLKALGRMDVVEKRRPQDGRITTRNSDGREIELRLSSMPTTFGEKLVMRIFDPQVLMKDLSGLGLDSHDQALWDHMVARSHGMIIVTGPTGSGKTTTLYSALRQLARPEINICTIEDPIELVDPRFNQMFVQHNIGLDFATGVRTLLRQDPDIIMIGEIRDHETAQTAVQAALTGHLVLSTLHTNDAPSSVIRFLDLGIAPYLLKSALTGIVAQRLVRTLCLDCREEISIDTDRWRSLVAECELPVPKSLYAAKGCEKCRHTGYRGRAGLFEILLMDNQLRESLGTDMAADQYRDTALAAGMRSLRHSGALKVSQGLTTIEEVLSVVQDF